MGKPSAPPPPDPRQTSAAQTGTSVSTAIANAILQNPSQITPYGSLDISFGGSGSSDIPQIEAFTPEGEPTSIPSGNPFEGGSLPSGGGTFDPSTLTGFGGGEGGQQQTAITQTGSGAGTRYRVGDQEFASMAEAEAYRNQLLNEAGETYTWTDPFTGETYTIPRMTITQNLTPEQQEMLDNQTQAGINMSNIAVNQSERIDELLNTPFSLDQFGEAAQFDPSQAPQFGSVAEAGDITRTYGTDFSEDRQRVEDALMERMNPSIDRQREQLEARLASQGIRIGSEPYQDAMLDMNRSVNDARLAAILNAGQEQSRLAGLESERAQFQNAAQAQQFGQNVALNQSENASAQQAFQNYLQGLQAQNATRAQGIEEAFAERNQPINEITALLSGSQVQNPNFTNPNIAGIPTTDNAGIINDAYQAQMQNYQSELGSWNNIWGGILGLGAGFI